MEALAAVSGTSVTWGDVPRVSASLRTATSPRAADKATQRTPRRASAIMSAERLLKGTGASLSPALQPGSIRQGESGTYDVSTRANP